MKNDTRYCYGANCAWNGPIQSVSNTKDHPRHQEMHKMFPTINSGDRVLQTKDFSLPCCPHCGGMLLQVDNKKIWDEQVNAYDKDHPGYKEMWEWSVKQNRCFKTIEDLAAEFTLKTGTFVYL